MTNWLNKSLESKFAWKPRTSATRSTSPFREQLLTNCINKPLTWKPLTLKPPTLKPPTLVGGAGPLGPANPVPIKNAALAAVAPHPPNRTAWPFLLTLAFTLALFCTLPLSAQSPRAKQVGMHLKCMCRGCDMTAGGCAHPGGAFSGPCDTAKAELKEVDEMLAKNMTEQQIIDAFVAKYGSIVYVEPPKKGFGLVAWIMPIFYVVVGLLVVVYVVRKWASRPPAVVPAAPVAHDPTLDRVRAQVDRETED